MVTGATMLTEQARAAWAQFLKNNDNRGHATRDSEQYEVDEYFQAALASARETIAMVDGELGQLAPKQVLEIGSSTGVNCFALQERYPTADVVGLEPEAEAIKVAEQLAEAQKDERPRFICGTGESIPLPSQSIDLIICSTVIEHVYDVEQVISEIARVLRPGGSLYLAAPNYVWPQEPHLQIWCIPILGKGLMRLAARLQGKKDQIGFLDHLQLVTPRRIERAFKTFGLSYHNYTKIKVARILARATDAKAYQRMRAFLLILDRFGVARPLISLALALGLYPSLLYFATPVVNDQREPRERTGE